MRIFSLLLWSSVGFLIWGNSGSVEPKHCNELNEAHVNGNQVLDQAHATVRRKRSPRFTSLTTAIGEQSNRNLREYDRLVSRGLPRAWVLSILRSRRHPRCYRMGISCAVISKYRNIDGTCNNIKEPSWGTSFQSFRRLFPAEYSDRYNKPKGLPPQRGFPSARLISRTIHSDLIKPDTSLTNMVPQVGQFLDHDFALTIEDDRKCCTDDKGHEDCFPIDIPNDDQFYSNLSVPQTCMDFTRSTAFCFPTGSGVREQFNIVTSYIDGSQIYGSTNERAIQLREFSRGRLRISSNNPKLLPTVEEVKAIYKTDIEFVGKYLAGDERVNEMPGLTVLHTIWVREHNRITDLMYKAKPSWNDEMIFQETRRIVIAEWQNVIYGQFLITILGNATMKKYRLDLGFERRFSTYNSSMDATLHHHFATAAYRFGHSLLNGLIRLTKGVSDIGSYLVRDNYFNPTQIERNGSYGYELILGGLMTQNAQAFDQFVSEDFTNFLFKEKEKDFGADLVARNIQRSRDHGIPNYAAYRRYCRLPRLSISWDNRPPEFLDETWQKLRSVYQSPLDIELFPGGLSELPQAGAASGPTFNCLKAMQFQRLKFGDRFFFMHRNQIGSFTDKQLRAIRRRTFGDVICDNSDIERTPLNVFLTASESNPWINCSDPRRSKLVIKGFL